MAYDCYPFHSSYKLTLTPADHLERPTARAISEHLWIIKKNAKATMGEKTAKNGSEKSTPKSTPKKNGKATSKDTPTKTPTKNSAKAKGAAGGKRKRVVEEEEDPKFVFSTISYATPYSTTSKYPLTAASSFSVELSDDVEVVLKAEDLDDAFDDGSEMSQTAKKSRTVPKSSSQPDDEAALMYDGIMEAI